MDDGKRENNKIKRSKTENVKTVVSVYLHRRQFPSIKPRKTSRNYNIKRALLDNRISSSNSILYSCYSSDPLVIEYSFMFQKFMYWLKDQTKYKHRCCDIEKLVGPLFCHFYLDILGSGHSEKAIAFFKAHVDKVDKSKCDETVKDLIKAITSDSEIAQLKEKVRSSKVVVELTAESLLLLKKFVLESSHIVFVQAFQKWFDIRVTYDTLEFKQDKHMTKNEVKEQKHNKLQSVIRGVKKLQMNICNIQITNNKNNVTCGIVKRQAGFVAFAECNILRIMPIHVLDSLFNLTDSLNQIKLNNHSKRIYSIAISLKNDILCTGAADHSICVYNMVKIKLNLKMFGHLGPIYCLAISSSGKYLVSGSQDGTCRLWNLNTGKMLRIFAGHTQAVTCLQFHPNTMYLATGSSDKNIRVWCLKSANPVRLLHAAKGTIYALAFDPSGQFLASASEDKKVRVWDLILSRVVYEFRCKESPVIKLVWSKNSKQLCGGTISGVIKVWEITHHSKDKDHKYSDPILTRQVDGKILDLEYTMGIWGSLSV